MAGKPNTKWKDTMIKKLGSEEAVKQFMKDIASKGGKNSSGYAFAHGKVDPRLAGKKSRKSVDNNISA